MCDVRRESSLLRRLRTVSSVHVFATVSWSSEGARNGVAVESILFSAGAVWVRQPMALKPLSEGKANLRTPGRRI